MSADYFTYVVVGNSPSGYPTVAMPFKTPLNYPQFKDYINSHTKRLHESGRNTIFQYFNISIWRAAVYKSKDYAARRLCKIFPSNYRSTTTKRR